MRIVETPSKSPAAIGRPPVPDDQIAQVQKLADEGMKPAEIITETGLSQTKVYEILRWMKTSNSAGHAKLAADMNSQAVNN